MLLLFIICFKNVDCDIYNVLYCLYIECKINLSIYLSNKTALLHSEMNAFPLINHFNKLQMKARNHEKIPIVKTQHVVKIYRLCVWNFLVFKCHLAALRLWRLWA